MHTSVTPAFALVLGRTRFVLCFGSLVQVELSSSFQSFRFGPWVAFRDRIDGCWLPWERERDAEGIAGLTPY